MKGIQIIIGDCLESLRGMQEKSVQCCVTSPPYFGLRDYGVDGQIGLEETPEAFIGKLVDVFREVRRVLADDGTLWVNLGDSYGKGKQLIGIPWKAAFSLQSDGWILRQDIIWHKPNPMPESVRDRCTKAHEYIFLLSKSQRYFYDVDAVKEPAKTAPATRNKAAEGYQADYPNGDRFSSGERTWGADRMKNRRSVWTVATKPFKGAHFATFPPDLIEPCILAGSRQGDTVLDPFNGAGTTGVISLKYGRKYIGCELNPEYADITMERIKNVTQNQDRLILFDG